MAKRIIDAEALSERMRLQYCKDCDNYNGILCGSCDIDFVFDMVEDAPTADVVEVRHGHWEVRSDEYEICASEFVCSVCKESFCSSELTDEQFFEMMQYCPHCGARMDGDDGETV